MDHEQETGFNEFMDAFDDTADYQTGEEEETPMEETAVEGTEEGTQPEAEAPEDGQEEQQDPGEEPAPETNPKPQDDMFILKVNKEEKTYTREEVISLAQKGADYDRVKEQLNQSRQTEVALQTKLDGQSEVMDTLAELAKETGMEIPTMLDSFRLAAMQKQGLSEDAAKERLLRLKAERETQRLKEEKPAEEKPAEETSQQRAKRDLEEFRKAYPDVQLTDELIGKLTPAVQGGASLLGAYRQYENAQKDAQIAELQRQLAAEKQNKENRMSSPGSQKDTGGKRTKTEYDDFMEAFG